MAAREIRTTCRIVNAGIPHPDAFACATPDITFLRWSSPVTWRVLRPAD